MVKTKVESLPNEPEQSKIVKDDSSSESEPPEPIQEAPARTTKRATTQKMVSCPNCSKEMLQKTFRYYHSLKCKPQQEDPAPVAPPLDRTPVAPAQAPSAPHAEGDVTTKS